MNKSALTLNGNTAIIYSILQELSQKNFITKTKMADDRIYIWAARQLVQKILEKNYKVYILNETIYRHFKKLHRLKLLDYVRDGWKDCFIFYQKIKDKMIYKKKEVDLNFNDEILKIFNNNSKDKILDPKIEFENFKDYNKNNGLKFKSIKFLNKKWTDWCVRIRPLQFNFEDSNLKLNSNIKKIAKKHITNEDISNAFSQFKLHHISKNTLMSNWIKGWELWCTRYESFKPKQQLNNTISKTAAEKADYKWNFRKLKDASDKLRNWLQFDLNINWIDDYYLKDKSITGGTTDKKWEIKFIDMMHPDYNKKEIILYKVASDTENLLSLDNVKDNIIDVEVLK